MKSRGIAATAICAVLLCLPGCGGADAPSESTMKAAIEDLPYEVAFRDVAFHGDGSVVVGVAKHKGIVQPFAFLSGEDVKVNGPVFPSSLGRVQRSSWSDSSAGPTVTVLMPPATKNGRPYRGSGRYTLNFALDEAICETWLTDEQCHSV